MRWCLLRVSLLTLGLFMALGGAKANEELPTDVRSTDQDKAAGKESEADGVKARTDISREELCSTVAAAAQEHALPLSFFSNLIWQESRFAFNAVSHAGAQGIAQFMPKTAA